MFRITAETCRAFTFTEVLIMAALNLENNARTSATQAYQISDRADSRGAPLL